MKKKDKKNLLIAIAVLATLILAGLGIWNYAIGEGSIFRYNQKSKLPNVAPIKYTPIENVIEDAKTRNADPTEAPDLIEIPDAIEIPDSTEVQDSGMDG